MESLIVAKVGQISNEGSQCGTVVSENGLFPTITAGCHGYANPHILTKVNGFYEQAIETAKSSENINYVETVYRIRKLTPRECWRLMGYTDADFDSAQSAGVSNSQLYKQAGNAIVKQVLMAIFKQMNIKSIKETA